MLRKTPVLNAKIRKAVADDEKTQGGAMMVLYNELVLARKAHSSQNSIKC